MQQSIRIAMPSSPIKVGFVGLSARGGWASITHGPSLTSLSNKYTLTAISTSSPESASQTADKFTKSTGHPIKSYSGNSDGIANDPDVELVAVAVKPLHHKEAALPVIKAGRQVFIEWPAGASPAETIELAEAARKQGVRSIVGLQCRQSSSLKKVQELLGEIGPVRSTTLMHSVPRDWGLWGPQVHDTHAWIHDPKANGSIYTIMFGHLLDGFIQTLGDFEYVSTTAGTIYPVVKVVREAKDGINVDKEVDSIIEVTSPDHVALTGKLNSGAIASIVLRGGIKATEGRRRFLWEIDGEDGSIRVEGPDMFGIAACSVYLNGKVVHEAEGGEMLRAISAAWTEIAKEEIGNYPTLNDAVKLHRLLEDIKRSEIEGRRVYVQ